MTAKAGTDILVAEDNEINQLVISEILELTGMTVRLVDDGAAAVAAFRSDRPRIVLMDLSMPVMNGLDATAAIRRIESEEGAGGRTPIVALTAHALKGDRERCIAAGMDDYISKPLSPDNVIRAVGRWLLRANEAATRPAA